VRGGGLHGAEAAGQGKGAGDCGGQDGRNPNLFAQDVARHGDCERHLVGDEHCPAEPVGQGGGRPRRAADSRAVQDPHHQGLQAGDGEGGSLGRIRRRRKE